MNFLYAFRFADDLDFTAVDVVHEYIGFVGSFFIVGAAAFYFLLLRPTLASNDSAMSVASRSAARIGLIGAILRALGTAMSASSTMAQKHVSLMQALTGRPQMTVMNVMTLVALIAFAAAAYASRDARGAWILAGIATLVVMLGGLVTTKVGRVVNPLHVFAASMWIGTLFVLVVAGISTALSGALTPNDRGPAIAMMVNRFSTIALCSAGLLVLTGLTTAWMHLGSIPALWTSIYGKTLIVKLCLVACVFGLGAYNNQRMLPSLGTEQAGRKLTRSATIEIAIAAIVLIVTAVLVNLPAPAEQMAH